MEGTQSKNSQNKDITNQFHESCSFSTPRQNHEDLNKLVEAGDQLAHHLDTNYGVLNSNECDPRDLTTKLPNIERNQSHVDNDFGNQSNLSEILPNSTSDFSSQFEKLVGEKNSLILENASELDAMNNAPYVPVKWHWFYCKYPSKNIWVPFSQKDSDILEKHYLSEANKNEIVVATDGTRFDVYLKERIRKSVYWDSESTEVRRCSWFFRNRRGSNFIPYDEPTAVRLEESYKFACENNEWSKRISINSKEEVILHSPTAFIHYGLSIVPLNCDEEVQTELQSSQIINVPSLKQCVVKRGLGEFNIPSDEPSKVDHLMFIVHGIGSYCDLKMRPIYEVVDDFRLLAQQLTQSHFKTSFLSNKIGRIEVLPVSWHEALHSESIDRKLKSITLPSIPRLRNFNNDTILDVLFYTSPTFCQTIINAVGNEMNRMYNLYMTRNTDFSGRVSIGGHSLGSLISFDLLWNQCPPSPERQKSQTSEQEESLSFEKEKAKLSRGVSYMTLGKAGTGQPYITYPQLNFHLDCFFGFGSPIGMFVTVRGIDSLGENFKFPTCPRFFNIFHPYDPVAYRIEPLINLEFENISPVQIPHHKGRKRMHLELKDTMAHVGAALKHRLVQSVKTTWNTFYQLAMFSKMPSQSIEYKHRKIVDQQTNAQATSSNEESNTLKIKAGLLNNGDRVDYVLQEAPLESFNEYLFAVGSHLCYWESEDTILLVLKEIYSALGVSPDSQVQHAMLPFDLSDEDGSNFSSSMQFEEPPGFNLSFNSLSPIFDEKQDN